MTELLLPPGLAYGVSAAFGLLIGSFLNVVIARLPNDESVVKPRSRCPGCGQAIAWYDNIPVVSWLALGMRCRKCKAPISARYPLVEIMTGLLFVASVHRTGASLETLLRSWPLVSLFVAITFIDLDHRIIPDELSLGGLALGLASCWLDSRHTWVEICAGAAFGYVFFWLVGWAYHRFTGRLGLGGGDVKLLAMIGAFTGPLGVLYTILISSVAGSAVGIGWGLLRGWRSGSRKSPRRMMRISIPYGPFLVIGALYCYLVDGGSWLLFTNPT